MNSLAQGMDIECSYQIAELLIMKIPAHAPRVSLHNIIWTRIGEFCVESQALPGVHISDVF